MPRGITVETVTNKETDTKTTADDFLSAPDLENIATEAQSFLKQFQTLQLATADEKGLPCASYAPYVQLSKNQYSIYISALAVHTANLIARPHASVFFIEPENESSQLFARKRLTLSCTAQRHARDSDRHPLIIDALTGKFGPVMKHLSSMTDFNTFTLTCHDASYVRGFGQAYRFSQGDLTKPRHINDKGHQEKGER